MISCSSKIVYNNLDWLASWYIDDYVTLTDAQELQFEPALNQLLDWHRQFELKNYINQIKLVQIEINDVEKTVGIKEHIVAFQGFWLAILTKVEPHLIKLAYSLSNEQVSEFLVASEQRNIDKIETFLNSSKDEQFDDSLDKIENRLKSFVGKLTPYQKHLIKTMNNNLLPTFNEWIEFRRTWAKSITNAYTIRNDRLSFESLLSRTILQADYWRSAEYLRKRAHNQKVWINTLEKLIVSLNKKQLKKLNDELDDIIGDLEDLRKEI